MIETQKVQPALKLNLKGTKKKGCPRVFPPLVFFLFVSPVSFIFISQGEDGAAVTQHHGIDLP